MHLVKKYNYNKLLQFLLSAFLLCTALTACAPQQVSRYNNFETNASQVKKGNGYIDTHPSGFTRKDTNLEF